MSKKAIGILFLAGALMLVSAGTASAFASWVEFANPRISYLSGDLYRFRVDVTWGGDTYTDPASGTVVDPILDQLWITNILGTPVNWTGNHSGAYGYSYAGDWYGGMELPDFPSDFGLHGPEFGWDFIPDAPLQSSYSLNFVAVTAWLDYDYAVNKRIEGGSEYFSGDLDVMVIPEPATALLFGIGLVGMAFFKRRR
jgi:hypothetical protein